FDNWIYAAYSRAGGGSWRKAFRDKGNPLEFVKRPELNVPRIMPGTNFKFKPNKYKVKPSGGMSQFGLSFNSYGDQFTVWNNIHIRHVVINDKYLRNNPYLDVGKTMAEISDHGNASKVY